MDCRFSEPARRILTCIDDAKHEVNFVCPVGQMAMFFPTDVVRVQTVQCGTFARTGEVDRLLALKKVIFDPVVAPIFAACAGFAVAWAIRGRRAGGAAHR